MEIDPRLRQTVPLQRCRLEKCGGACCLHGVWIDRKKVEEILEHAELIASHMPVEDRDPSSWFDERTEPDPHTPGHVVRHSTVVEAPEHYGGTACVFLRPDHTCALQVAAQSIGAHPWMLKPFYCILHPLNIDQVGRLTIEDTDLLLSEPASCLRRASECTRLDILFADELEYLQKERDSRE